MTIERVDAPSLPRSPVGPAAAVRGAGLVFPSGQLAADAQGRLAEAARVPAEAPYSASPIKRQARVVLDQLQQVLKGAGSSLERVAKAQVFLADLHDFVYFDEVWREHFPTPLPRTVVAAPGLLVAGARLLLDVVAVHDPGLVIVPITGSGPRPDSQASEATRVGPLVYASGQRAADFATGVPAAVKAGGPPYGSAIKAQARYVLQNLARTLEAAGSSLDHVVKTQVFVRDLRDFPRFDEVWKEFFTTPPPRTTVGMADLLIPEALVEVDVIAVTRDAPWRREVIPVPPGVPAPMANYSVGVKAGPLVFVAGQIASDYATGVPPEARVPDAFPYYGVAIKRQTAYVLRNIEPVLKAAGTSFERVVKAQVFLTDLADYPGFEEVWKTFFPTSVPLTVVGTTGLLVPGTSIEIDLTALA